MSTPTTYATGERAPLPRRGSVYRGDAGLLNGELDKYLAVTKDDIKRVVGKYLVPNRRNVVEVKPGEKARESSGERK